MGFASSLLVSFAIAALIALGTLVVSPARHPPTPQSVPLVDSDQIDGSIFQPYDNAWSIKTRAADGTVTDAGISSDHVRLMEIDGKRQLSRLETTASAGGDTLAATESIVSTTFNVSDPKTLRPIFGEERSSDGDSVRRTFSAERVVIRTKSSPAFVEQTQEAALPRPVYGLRGGMAGLLLAALPLRIGLIAKFPNFNGRKYDESLVRVVGQELIAAGHLGRKQAWVVDIGQAGRVRYWVTKTAPYVLKVRISSDQGETVWDTI